MSKIKDLIIKYKDIISYLFFGVCTTIVNYLVYYVCAHPLGLYLIISNVIAWIVAVIFAYITNRIWVFHSKAKGFSAIIKEISSFFGCRVFTLLFETAFMYVFVEVLGFNDLIIKLIANVFVIVLNYIGSKLLVFTSKKKTEESNG